MILLPIGYWYVWVVVIYHYWTFVAADDTFHQLVFGLTYCHMLVFFVYLLLASFFLYYVDDRAWLKSKKREYMLKVQYLHLMEGLSPDEVEAFIALEDVENYNTPTFSRRHKIATVLYATVYIVLTFAVEAYSARNYLSGSYLHLEQRDTEGNCAYAIITVTFAFLGIAGVPFITLANVPYSIKQLALATVGSLIYLFTNLAREHILPVSMRYLDTIVPTGTICLLVLGFVHELSRPLFKWVFLLVYILFWLPLYLVYPLLDSEELSASSTATNAVYYLVT